jgi:polysaccharide export outer membrane protein
VKTRVSAVSVILLLLLSQAWASVPQGTYKVGPGDVLEVSVWGHETLKREIVVPPDGVLSFPLIKELDVRGMDVSAIRESVTAKLSPFVPDATVTVILLKSQSLAAYVIGKVNRPGPYPTNLDTTVMQILSMAGGFTPFASPDKIFILRQLDGKPQKIAFDYNQELNGKNLDQDIVLQRGDVVVVP